MKKVIDFFIINQKNLIISYILINLLYLFFSPVQFRSDSLYYYQLSLESLKSGAIYPSDLNLYADYIVAPIYININAFLLSVYNSIFTIRLFQVLLNLMQFLFLYKVTNKIYGKNVAAIFSILYIFYLPNLGMTLLNFTELFFGFLLSLSLWYLLKEKIMYLVLSGIITAAAINVRPTGWALLISIIIYILITKNEYYFKQLAFYFTGLIFFFILAASTSYLSSSHFVIASVTHGTNLIMGANDDATGAYNDVVFEKGKIGYIDKPEQKTYIYKQQFWFNNANNWILQNPIKWIKLIPLKLIHLFIWDDYAISQLCNLQEWNLNVIAKHFFVQRNPNGFMSGIPVFIKAGYLCLQIIHHLYYYLIIVFFVLVLSKFRKQIFNQKVNILLVSILSLSLLMPIVTVSVARYKYPYILIIIIFISPYLKYYLLTRRN